MGHPQGNLLRLACPIEQWAAAVIAAPQELFSAAGENPMITSYLDKALRRARYKIVDNGVFCATVPGLQGVIATGSTLEDCRDQLAEVLEEWILVRVARGLRVPPMGGVKVEVKKAS